MDKKIKWIIGTILVVISMTLLLEFFFPKDKIVREEKHNDEVHVTNDMLKDTDSSDVMASYDEDITLITETVKEFLGIYHTYSQIDSSYMCKMEKDYMTSKCMYAYLMAGMDGKSPWNNDEELMAYLENYEPNRVNNQYIINPQVTCHVSELDIVYEPYDETNGRLWCYYEVCHDYITIKDNEYYDQMARLEVVKKNDGWKVSYIDFISIGGIKGYYGSN